MGVQKSRVSFFKSSSKFYTNYSLKNFVFFNTNFWQTSYPKKKEEKKTWYERWFGISSYKLALQRWAYIQSLRIRTPHKSFNTSPMSSKKIKRFSVINKELIIIDVHARRVKRNKKNFKCL